MRVLAFRSVRKLYHEPEVVEFPSTPESNLSISTSQTATLVLQWSRPKRLIISPFPLRTDRSKSDVVKTRIGEQNPQTSPRSLALVARLVRIPLGNYVLPSSYPKSGLAVQVEVQTTTGPLLVQELGNTNLQSTLFSPALSVNRFRRSMRERIPRSSKTQSTPPRRCSVSRIARSLEFQSTSGKPSRVSSSPRDSSLVLTTTPQQPSPPPPRFSTSSFNPTLPLSFP